MNDSQKGGARLMKSEHKRRELAPLLAIFGILVGLALASLLTPEREFSPNENRYLQLKPSLTWTTLMDGTFTQKAEDYVADQIALRDRWMEASSLVQRAALRLEINDTWLGRDGRYFAKVTPDTFDTAQYEKNLAQVKAFFDANPDKDCCMMMVPTPAYMLRDDLPANAPLFDAEGCFDTLLNTMGGQAIDLRAALLPDAANMYYRTDHHWTTQGALTAYQAWCAATGHTPQDWQLETASTCFRTAPMTRWPSHLTQPSAPWTATVRCPTACTAWRRWRKRITTRSLWAATTPRWSSTPGPTPANLCWW